MPGITTSLTPSAIGSANIAGLGSGIDFNATVDQLIAVEKQKVTLLETRQTAETTKQATLNTLNSNVTAMRNAAAALKDSSAFFSNTASLTSNTVTDPSTLLKVTPSSTAVAGTHTIKVNALATAEKFGSSAFVKDASGVRVASAATSLQMAGAFTIQGQASAAQTITVTASDSLQSIATQINNFNTGSDPTGVTASVLTVNSTAGTEDFRLIITADNTGVSKGTTGLTSVSGSLAAGGTLVNLNIDPLLAGTPPPTGTETLLQAAADASLTIDGVATPVLRDSNTITDALPGFTLDLLNVDIANNTTVTVTTAIDQTSIKAKIQSFVDAFNTVQNFINDQMKFDVNTQTNGILASDSTVRTLQSQMGTSILQTIVGLPSDRNNIVLLGVAPDSTGNLVIDDAKLTSFLSTDPTAVRDVFALTGAGSVSSLQFVDAGLNTVAGTYAVNITTAAVKANVLSADLVTIPLTAVDTVTVTDGFSRQAIIPLAQNQLLASIVTDLNGEFNKVNTEQRQMGTAMLTGSGGGTAATSATLLADLTDGSNNLNIANGDIINITGTKRSGGAISGVNGFNFPVDITVDTLGSLLSAIQVAFDQQVTASVDSAGRITITDNTAGDSSLTFNLSVTSSGTLNFGTETVAQEGRYALDLTASVSGSSLKIEANGFGPGSNFTVKQTNGASSDLLGLGGAVSGTDFLTTVANGSNLAGTIGGFAAIGSGQSLLGTTGNTNELLLLYTSSLLGSVGNISVSLGSGFLFDNLLDTFTNPVTGLLQADISSSQTTFNDFQTKIDEMNARIEQDRARLTKSFQQMELLINNFNAQGQFLSQQIGFSTAKR